MSTLTEPETIGELIADCADLPAELHACASTPATPKAAPHWTVDERCHAQVAELDAYV
ncbi:hypothetical protein [Amycolatopsis magusensis]|uniref:Uncharacterized protein n=1 Tax=Amycolatopsis magusensis TaxID=882444 RepID=A0ABS4Q3L8_9PSEU|nr:hypothetical protein [Amycolatopsis magusensis]MBP2186288.1 hypothetical protein [Amycolatopsis magusensis]MDI5976213.1 hypothetical protein [Amycolatopsis magusensis]